METTKFRCPDCNGTNIRLVEGDGGYECLDCDNWFWFTEEELNEIDNELERLGEAIVS